MTRIFLMVFGWVILFPSSSRAESFTAEVFDESKTTQLYTLKALETGSAGSSHREATFTSSSGGISFQEKTDLDDGRLKSYAIDQKEARLSGIVQVSGKKLQFSFTQNGKTKTDDEDFKENTVVPPTASDFILKHWDDLMKGDDSECRFAVLDRQETVGFKFFKVGEETRDGKELVKFRMKPTSFIIAAILPKPVIFIFDKGSKRLIEFHGRIPFKRFANGKLADQDGVIVYHYQ